ncbi:MAG: DEAD/DEAH box helicase, partial [Erysipelotrichaceae bacterium]|nr:DEAD/DEAH box helicase [Erysipelotrichaceae bacterium]
EFRLYEHQENVLEAIEKTRNDGINSFLVVLPTASGKSKVIEEDLKRFLPSIPKGKVLILAPSHVVKNDWNRRVEEELKSFKHQIDVQTYSYMEYHYSDFDRDYYDYMVVDEAHHAVAPCLKRMIQYFTPKFLIGLTATDERPDKKKLESVFGSYRTPLSLKDAMEKGIIAKANAFRIETNIDLSKVRINGKDYVNADLENKIRVTSRNELIVDVLKEYFCEGDIGKRQGIIFCINIKHAEEMEKLLNKAGISARAYSSNTKHPELVMEEFNQKKIRFLCSCSMISEGWDYPEMGILVMARPTLSKVLYLQQLGRGLRKTKYKKNVFVVDVVDSYGSMVTPCNLNTIFHNPCYVPFGDITRRYEVGEFIEIDGLVERVERIVEVDVESFDEKYGNYLSVEQLAREFFINTSTINNWIKKGKVIPSVQFVFGSKKIAMFSPEDVEKYRVELEIKEHNDETIKEDFFDFLEERDYALSYKMTFLLSFLKHLDKTGDAKIDEVLNDYISFYQDRVDQGLVVDRKTCPYNNETLKDIGMVKRSMLVNPFEKFERKRFMYYSKDLNIISMNHALFSQLNEADYERIKRQMEEDRVNYYSKLLDMNE